MMRHSSLKKVPNLYQKESAKKLIDPKLSPEYKKVHKSKNFQVVVMNPNLRKSVGKVQKRQSLPKAFQRQPLYYSQLNNNPQKKKVSIPSSIKDLRISLNQKLKEQSQKFRMERSRSQQLELQFKENRKIKERLRTQELQQQMQQIQFKKKQMMRQKNIKLRRTTSQRSFVLENHAETIKMMKQSRQVRSRCQQKDVKERFRDTEKEHNYLVIQQSVSYKHKSHEQKYQKAFLKNAPLPKYKYPNLSDMLAIASKTLNANQKVEFPQKKNPSRQKLASITAKTKPKDKKNEKKELLSKKASLKEKVKEESVKEKCDEKEKAKEEFVKENLEEEKQKEKANEEPANQIAQQDIGKSNEKEELIEGKEEKGKEESEKEAGEEQKVSESKAKEEEKVVQGQPTPEKEAAADPKVEQIVPNNENME